MPLVNVQELIDAGVHYGHQASRWNPKMKPYIHGKRHNVHIIDLQETIKGLYQATHFLRSLAKTGAQVMFLGTKRQIRGVVEAEAARCGMPAVTERWIGGTLTNFHTVRERLARLEELEAMEADGSLENRKKKEQSMLRREMAKIRRNLEGVRHLHGLPAALVVIDPRREEITVREAAKMNVPVLAILDTDCNPEAADIVIPANDDAMSSVQLIMKRLADAVIEGRQGLDEQTLMQAQKEAREDLRARPAMGRRSEPQRGGGGGRGRGRSGGGGGGGGGARGGLGAKQGGRFASGGKHADAVSVGGSAEDVEITPVPAPAPATDGAAPDPAAAAPAPSAPTEPAAPEGGGDATPPSS